MGKIIIFWAKEAPFRRVQFDKKAEKRTYCSHVATFLNCARQWAITITQLNFFLIVILLCKLHISSEYFIANKEYLSALFETKLTLVPVKN